MKFDELKSKALEKKQMRAMKGGGLNGNGTCGAKSASGTVICGVSKEVALSAYAGGGSGASWCCDSCGSSSYCG